MKKSFVLSALLIVMVVSGFFGTNLMQAMAKEESVRYHKYYTCIRLEEGDTLWTIAEQYGENSGKSQEEYVRELRAMNSLLDDTIHAGNFLTICYYRVEE